MAGEGYRTWVPGEVITADNVQEYLQDQTVQVHPDSAARGSALTGFIAEGMISYLEDTDAVEVYNGTAWVGLGGDAPIFTQGTSGEYLKSLGTAGVEWDTVDLPGAATPGTAGLVPGSNTLAVGTSGTAAFPGLSYGFEALEVATGAGNVAIGSRAGKVISTGGTNTVVGTSAGIKITTGQGNTAIGYRSLEENITGSNNLAIGNTVGAQITGSSNTVVNSSALLTTGSKNISVGFGSVAFSASTGSNNTLLGSDQLSGAVDTLNGSNNTVLGFEAAPSTNSVSNEITLGNSSVTALRCQVTSISSLSDQRDKKDIADLGFGLDFVKELRPVEFTWNTRIPETITRPDGSVVEFSEADVKRDVPDIGFIAQDLMALEDEHQAHDQLQLTYRSNPDRLEATQGRLIPILVKAIQELSAEVEALKASQA